MASAETGDWQAAGALGERVAVELLRAGGDALLVRQGENPTSR